VTEIRNCKDAMHQVSREGIEFLVTVKVILKLQLNRVDFDKNHFVEVEIIGFLFFLNIAGNFTNIF
jgi:hypothetical protein